MGRWPITVRGTALGGILLVVLLAVGSRVAMASPAQGSVTLSPPGTAEGRLSLGLAPNSFVAAYAIGGDADVQLQIDIERLDLERIDYTNDYVAFRTHALPIPNSADSSQTPMSFTKGSLELVQTTGNFTLIIQPREEARVESPHFRLMSPLRDVFLSSEGPGEESLEPFPHNPWWPNHYDLQASGVTHHFQTDTLDFDHKGTFLFFLSGADIEVRNATGKHPIRTGSWEEPAPDDPTDSSTVRVRHHGAVLVGNITGKVHVSYRGPYGHAAFPTGTLADVHRLTAPLSQATFDVAGQTYTYDNESHLNVEGRFTATFPATSTAGQGTPIQLTIDGDVAQIMENRLTVQDFGKSRSAATAAAGIGLLVFVYVVVSFLRRGAVYVGSKALFVKWLMLAPLSARLDPGEVLDQPARRALVDLLGHRGAPWSMKEFRDMANQHLGISRIAVYYHLRHLHAAGKVVFYRSDGAKSLWVGLERQGSAKPAAAALDDLLSNAPARALAKVLVGSGELPQDDLFRRATALVAQPEGGQDPARPMTRQAWRKWLLKLERFGQPRRFQGRQVASADLEPRRADGATALVASRKDGRFMRYKALPLLIEALAASGPQEIPPVPNLRRLSPAPASLRLPDVTSAGIPSGAFPNLTRAGDLPANQKL